MVNGPDEQPASLDGGERNGSVAGERLGATAGERNGSADGEGNSSAGAGEPALPVLAEPRAEVLAAPIGRGSGAIAARGRSGGVPVAQAAAVAAGTFVAGAAFAGLVHRRRSTPALARTGQAGGRFARALTRRGQRGAKAPELVEIVASRTLLVDVHLLGPPASDR